MAAQYADLDELAAISDRDIEKRIFRDLVQYIDAAEKATRSLSAYRVHLRASGCFGAPALLFDRTEGFQGHRLFALRRRPQHVARG